jgi:glycine dehydrogenase
MLSQIGMTSLDALIGQTIPKSIRSTAPLALDAPLSEATLLSHMQDLAGKTKS